MVVIRQEMDDVEFWSNIWGAEPQSFGEHWEELGFLDGADWNIPGIAYVVLEDPDDDGTNIVKILGIEDLADAYGALLTHQGSGGVHRDYLDLENLDCIGADAIIQYAVYGRVIFG